MLRKIMVTFKNAVDHIIAGIVLTFAVVLQLMIFGMERLHITVPESIRRHSLEGWIERIVDLVIYFFRKKEEA